MRKSTMPPRTPLGNRQSMAPRSTLKSRQSVAQRYSVGVRYSMGGKASIGPGSVKTDKKKMHTNKDPRRLNEKGRQRELCSQICDFLLETSFPQNFTIKELMNISTANYFMIFSHFCRHILGSKYVLKGSREESILATMKLLGYPFGLQKSSFTNFSLTSWPIVLGVLEFLLRAAEKVISFADADDFDAEIEEGISRQNEDDPLVLVIDGYRKLMQGDGEDNDAINDEIVRDYQDFKLQGMEEEQDYIERQMEAYGQETNDFDKISKEKLEIESAVSQELTRSSEVLKYLDFEQKMVSFHQSACEKSIKIMEEKKIVKSQHEEKIRDLTDQIGDKETAHELKKRLVTVQGEQSRKMEEKMAVENIKNNLDVSSTKEKANIADIIQEYNCLILDNEMDHALSIPATHQYTIKSNATQIFVDQTEKICKEITTKKFDLQSSEFRLKELTTKRGAIDEQKNSSTDKFERKERQFQRAINSEQIKVDALKKKQTELFEYSDELDESIAALKLKSGELSKYNEENNIDAMENKIKKDEEEWQTQLVDNMTQVQDQIVHVSEETDKLLLAQIEERKAQLKLVEDQISSIPE